MLHSDATIAVGEVRQISVVIWRGAVTAVPFELQRAGLAETVKGHPDGAGFLCIVEKTAKPPEDELRRASSQMIQAHGAALKFVACVIEGDGFLASINRSALAGMGMLLRNKKTAISVFAKVPEASVWMKKHIDFGSLDAFISAVEYIRSQLIGS
jgi:hypothetical protein